MILTLLAAIQTPAPAALPPTSAPEPQLTELRKADGALAARAMVYAGAGGLEVRIQAAGLAPGRYGAHVHAVGRCDAPDFETAGPHWNPTGREHGTLNPQGHHLGDLPNFEIGEDGHGRLEFAIDSATLRGSDGMLDEDGAAIVIHARPDDYRTDPSGNSGARIACGVLR